VTLVWLVTQEPPPLPLPLSGVRPVGEEHVLDDVERQEEGEERVAVDIADRGAGDPGRCCWALTREGYLPYKLQIDTY